MKKMMQVLFIPIKNISAAKLFLLVLPLVAGLVFIFINPAKLAETDFMLIAWNPAQELLTQGAVHAEYPYPLWTVILTLPFTVWDLKTSMLLWFGGNVLLLAGSLALLLDVLEWTMTPFLFAVAVSLSTFFLPVLSSLWLGQTTIFILFVLVLITRFFVRQQWLGLGVALGLSLIKPQVIIMLVGLILLWALFQRRWRIWLGFGAVVAALVLISLPFLANARQIVGGGIGVHLTAYLPETSTLWALALKFKLPLATAAILSLVLMLWTGWLWLPMLRGHHPTHARILFLFSLTAIVNLIVVPYSWMHNLVLLLQPYGYSLSLAMKTKAPYRPLWLMLLFLLMQPFTMALHVILGGTYGGQSYQVLPALVLIFFMTLLEARRQQTTG